MFQLADAPVLLLLLLVPFMVWWRYALKKKGHRHISFSAASKLKELSGGAKVFMARNMFWLKVVAFTLIVFALARPQIVNSWNVEKKKGINILVALDLSTSMKAMDFKPKNRLEVAKEVIGGFIDKRKNDRIGLVTFAGTSYTKCPLTVDYDILRYYLKRSNIGDLEDGTAIGMALATSVNRIRGAKKGAKVIILLTDGVNNRGEIDPADAANIAKDYGVKIYTIGVGTRGKAPFIYNDPYLGTRQIMMDVEIDEKLLKDIANKTGGLYFRATDKESLKDIFSEIDRWEKVEISAKKFSEAKEIYHFFLLAGLLLLILVEILRRSWLRVLP